MQADDARGRMLCISTARLQIRKVCAVFFRLKRLELFIDEVFVNNLAPFSVIYLKKTQTATQTAKINYLATAKRD